MSRAPAAGGDSPEEVCTGPRDAWHSCIEIRQWSTDNSGTIVHHEERAGYDVEGRFVRLEHDCDGDLDETIIYRRDGSGRLTGIETHDHTGALFHWVLYRHDERGRVVVEYRGGRDHRMVDLVTWYYGEADGPVRRISLDQLHFDAPYRWFICEYHGSEPATVGYDTDGDGAIDEAAAPAWRTTVGERCYLPIYDVRGPSDP